VGALKGVGRGVIDAIVAERDENGPFADLFDFCRRLDGRKVNRRVIEALIKSGAMDGLDDHRAALMADVEKALRTAGQEQSNEDAGQSDMFGVTSQPLVETGKAPVDPWTEEQRLAGERETLGVYLTGHPFNRFRDQLSSVVDGDVRNLDLSTPRYGVFAGLVVGLRVLNTRRGKMAFVAVDDGVCRIEVSLFSGKFSEYADIVQKDCMVVVRGELSTDEFSGNPQMRADSVYTIDQLRTEFLREITIEIHQGALGEAIADRLQELLAKYHGGGVAIVLKVQLDGGETGVLRFGENWRVRPESELIDGLRDLLADPVIRYRYDATDLRSVPERERSGRSRRSGFG
jgi:DNA polymerase-3 subunit alpha